MTSVCLSWLAEQVENYGLAALAPSVGAGDEVLLPPEVDEEPPAPDLAGSPQADSSNANVAAVAAIATGLIARVLRGEEAVFCVDVFRMRGTFNK
jgi:hypothetical protein